MSRACPKRQNTQDQTSANQTETTLTKARLTEVVDDRDNISDVESEATAVTNASKRSGRTNKGARVNNLKMVPSEVVKVLSGMTEEQRGEVLDQILLNDDEDF